MNQMNWTQTKTTIAAIAAVLCTGLTAYGQTAQPVIPLQAGAPVGSGNPLYIQGTLTASLGGFTPSASGARMTQLSVTTSDSSGTLPTGAVVVVSNTGANPMFCNVNAVAATTSDQLIAASSWFSFTIPSGVTTLHCIATGSSTTADGVGGSGLATGAGGGGGSSGGGAVYGPTANGSAAANPPVIIGGTANGGATGNVANAMIVAGNTAGTTNPAIIVADPNVLAAVNAAVPGYYATAYNTCSQLTGTTAPICVDLNGNLYANISRYMGTAGTANASVMTVQGIASMTPFLTTTTLNAETTKVIGAVNQGTSPWVTSVSTVVASHASTTALGTSLVAKASAGSLFGYNCTGIAGAAAGYCIAYNGTTAPGTGALTGANVLDFCYFDTTARGCSLSRIPLAAAYGTGIVILLSSATTPYTYTTGTDTGAISADYQ